jgi:hypothetical protein
MRGRRPSGPEYVDHLQASELAKLRVKTILDTLTGKCRVQEACERLGVSEPRFAQLRERFLLAGLERMEPRQAGRPPRQLSPIEAEILALKEQLADTQVELRAAGVRAEIALALPKVVQPTFEEREKKNRGPRKRRRFRPPATRNNT